MSVDKNVYEFAKTWLIHAGWCNTICFDELAEKLQECIEDHMADLTNKYEEECRENRNL